MRQPPMGLPCSQHRTEKTQAPAEHPRVLHCCRQWCWALGEFWLEAGFGQVPGDSVYHSTRDCILPWWLFYFFFGGGRGEERNCHQLLWFSFYKSWVFKAQVRVLCTGGFSSFPNTLVYPLNQSGNMVWGFLLSVQLPLNVIVSSENL